MTHKKFQGRLVEKRAVNQAGTQNATMHCTTELNKNEVRKDIPGINPIAAPIPPAIRRKKKNRVNKTTKRIAVDCL
ncbi:MAG: hypothetical protein K2J78_09095 [Muribaculaceae bacterium]|nr:hypothetical protein [Muribaculaceae bacterium]MDE6769862.1 hypothetical protein [Muribaculaceae bacterium]